MQIKQKRSVLIMVSNAWYRVPAAALQNERLTGSDVLVLAVICDRADGQAVTMSAQDIANECAVSVITVKRAVKKLSEVGYISIEHQTGGASSYRQLILEPKRRGKGSGASETRGAGKPKKASSYDEDFDVEKYKVFINNF